MAARATASISTRTPGGEPAPGRTCAPDTAASKNSQVDLVVAREVAEVGEVRVHLDDVVQRAARRLEARRTFSSVCRVCSAIPPSTRFPSRVVRDLARRVDRVARDHDRRVRRLRGRQTLRLQRLSRHLASPFGRLRTRRTLRARARAPARSRTARPAPAPCARRGPARGRTGGSSPDSRSGEATWRTVPSCGCSYSTSRASCEQRPRRRSPAPRARPPRRAREPLLARPLAEHLLEDRLELVAPPVAVAERRELLGRAPAGRSRRRAAARTSPSGTRRRSSRPRSRKFWNGTIDGVRRVAPARRDVAARRRPGAEVAELVQRGVEQRDVAVAADAVAPRAPEPGEHGDRRRVAAGEVDEREAALRRRVVGVAGQAHATPRCPASCSRSRPRSARGPVIPKPDSEQQTIRWLTCLQLRRR